MVLIMVYTLRDFGGLTAALQSAADKGAFVAILTDVDVVFICVCVCMHVFVL